jgi:hypothetical protein
MARSGAFSISKCQDLSACHVRKYFAERGVLPSFALAVRSPCVTDVPSKKSFVPLNTFHATNGFLVTSQRRQREHTAMIVKMMQRVNASASFVLCAKRSHQRGQSSLPMMTVKLMN